MDIRLLTKDDIDVRVAQTTTTANGGVKVSLLLYKDARVDMKILDELFTPLGWQRTHKTIDGRLYCVVSVWDENKGWVSKEDVGTESNTEAEKGQASDSFKRACFNWGIGRELYTAPKISVELNDKEYTMANGKPRVWASFQVGTIGYDENTRTINKLEIVDRFGNVRFSMGNEAKSARKSAVKKATANEIDQDTYWKIVAAYAVGKPSKDGRDYKSVWEEMCKPGMAQREKFDHDVENYKIANGI